MKTLAKSEIKGKAFEAVCLVEETGEEVVIVSQGNPILKISPISKRERILSPDEIFKDLRPGFHCQVDLTETTVEK